MWTDLVGGLLGGMPAGAIGTIAGGAAGAAVEVLNGFRDQFQQTTDQHVTAFGQALTTLGPGPVIDMSAAEPLLQPIISTMNLTLVGNSVQDLRLSLAGWKLGQDILGGSVSTGTDVASWVRSNLM